MEKYCKRFGGRVGLLWFFLGISILLHCCKAENTTDPTANLNLSPFWAWRSAYWCMRNAPGKAICPKEYMLTGAGWINVTQGDVENFCNNGCAENTRAVLKCIHYVKRDYWFADKSTVKDLNATINHICSSPSNYTSSYIRSGNGKTSVSIMSALSAMVLVTLFYYM